MKLRANLSAHFFPTTPIFPITASLWCALQEDSKASYIYLYKRDGTSLDIMVKSLLSGDGYPVDLSLSPNGTDVYKRQVRGSYRITGDRHYVEKDSSSPLLASLKSGCDRVTGADTHVGSFNGLSLIHI